MSRTAKIVAPPWALEAREQLNKLWTSAKAIQANVDHILSAIEEGVDIARDGKVTAEEVLQLLASLARKDDEPYKLPGGTDGAIKLIRFYKAMKAAGETFGREMSTP